MPKLIEVVDLGDLVHRLRALYFLARLRHRRAVVEHHVHDGVFHLAGEPVDRRDRTQLAVWLAFVVDVLGRVGAEEQVLADLVDGLPLLVHHVVVFE